MCSTKLWVMPALLTEAVFPSSHWIRSALRPWMADQVLSATTATPVEICTTCFTPGTVLALESSKLATLPPNTGQRATTACSIPGTRTSIPKIARPSTFSGVSRRLWDFPITLYPSAVFSVTFAGRGNLPASSASAPKLSRAFVAVLTTVLFSALHCVWSTLHRAAAACTSISRAAAPACRRGPNELRMLPLPTTPWNPPYAGSIGAKPVRIFCQSHSSSSANSMDKDVTVPCPISPLCMISVTKSSDPTCTKAFKLAEVTAAPDVSGN